MRLFPLVGAMLLVTACGSDVTGPTHVDCDEFLVVFGEAPGDTIETAQGLQYIDVLEGSGSAAASGNTVDVNYSGYLLNGTRFDTSCNVTRAVLRFTLGAGELIPGFEMGVTGMRPGGVRRVIIPPSLGYGSQPQGSIPANSTLIFDLEVVGFVR